jgi:hypothetical protein
MMTLIGISFGLKKNGSTKSWIKCIWPKTKGSTISETTPKFSSKSAYSKGLYDKEFKTLQKNLGKGRSLRGSLRVISIFVMKVTTSSQ